MDSVTVVMVCCYGCCIVFVTCCVVDVTCYLIGLLVVPVIVVVVYFVSVLEVVCC